MQSFKIGHHDYKIKYQDHVKTEDGELLDGKCDNHGKVITMSNDFKNKDFQNAVLLHEMLHGIIYESGYVFDDFEQEEDFTYIVGKTLHGFLKNNIEQLSEIYEGKQTCIKKTKIKFDDLPGLEEKLEGYKPQFEEAIKNTLDKLKYELTD